MFSLTHEIFFISNLIDLVLTKFGAMFDSTYSMSLKLIIGAYFLLSIQTEI